MLDRETIKKNYLEYVDNYEQSGRVTLKRIHILRVADRASELATNLNLTPEQIELAYVIGICHDIGRFEQVKRYNTFSDKKTGMDHAAWSVKVLFEDNLIRSFIDTDKYDELIKVAVLNHNKTMIDESLTGDELLFSKIIRDADKLDILYVITSNRIKDIFWYDDFGDKMIKKKLILDFYAKKYLDYGEVDTNMDQIVTFYSYIYDFNFKESLKIIKENNYYDTFNKRVKLMNDSKLLHEQLDNLLNSLKKYIEIKESE